MIFHAQNTWRDYLWRDFEGSIISFAQSIHLKYKKYTAGWFLLWQMQKQVPAEEGEKIVCRKKKLLLVLCVLLDGKVEWNQKLSILYNDLWKTRLGCS